jgi:hypothetical protein
MGLTGAMGFTDAVGDAGAVVTGGGRHRGAGKAHVRREEFGRATAAVLEGHSRTLYVRKADRLSRRGSGRGMGACANSSTLLVGYNPVGYNREDIMAELMFRLMNGRRPPACPKRRTGSVDVPMPTREIPERADMGSRAKKSS